MVLKETEVSTSGYSLQLVEMKLEGTVLENEIYRIEFELYSGYITSFRDKIRPWEN